jgi:2-oxoglutarate ferredoxin oxidoreductase subunit beta
MALSYPASFVGRAFSGQIKEMITLFVQALRHPGFAFIQVLSPCVTFYNTYDHYREMTQAIPEDHDPTDQHAAMALAMKNQTQYLGLFYQDTSRTTYGTRLDAVQSQAPRKSMAEIFESLRR